MNTPDIYFEEFWGSMNAEHDGGTYHSYEYEDENGMVLYRFIKRPTNILPDTYDILTPSGFSGPVVITCKKGRKKDLIAAFDKSFGEYCHGNNIVAEYVRFSPWVKNAEDFGEVYDLSYKCPILCVDLQKKDFFNEEFSSNCRNHIRKAEKKGVQIKFDFTGETIDEFYRLYSLTAERDRFAEMNKRSREYISTIPKMCEGHFFIINAAVGEKIVSSAIFIHSDKYLHYHL